MMLLAARIAQWLGVPFYVDGFRAAFWGALVVSVASIPLNALLADDDEDEDEHH
jgi:uncharacterized membrane protein YvlD (DUF360 family)